MFKKKKTISYTDTPDTIISAGITIKTATICGGERLRIDGTIIGDIEIQNSVVISETGEVKGNIDCDCLLVAGNVNGNIKAKNQVHLTSTATIIGNVNTNSLITDDGAIILGNYDIGSDRQNAPSTITIDKPEPVPNSNDTPEGE